MSEANTSFERITSVSEVDQEMNNENNNHGLEEVSDNIEEALPVLSQEALPVLSQEALPVLSQEALPVLSQEALPVLSQEALPVLSQEALPVLSQEALPVLSQEALPVLSQDNTEGQDNFSQENKSGQCLVSLTNGDGLQPVSHNTETIQQIFIDNEEGLHKVLHGNYESVFEDNKEGQNNFCPENKEEIEDVSLNMEEGSHSDNNEALHKVLSNDDCCMQSVSQDNTKHQHQYPLNNEETLYKSSQDNTKHQHQYPLNNEETLYKSSQDNRENIDKVSQDNYENIDKVSQDNYENIDKVSQDNYENIDKVSQDNYENIDIVSPDNIQHQDNSSLGNGGAVNILNADIVIKQEVVDFLDYESFSSKYRGKPIVVYSDSDSESSSSSADSPVIPRALDEGCDEDRNEHQNRSHPHQSTSQAVKKFVSRTEGEIFPEELPPLEYLTISPDENVKLEPLGIVSGIVDVLVVVKAFTNSPALYDDTVLFLEGRRPLGLIFETFGTVHQPFYSVRFNCNKDIIEQNIELGNKVFFAPKASNLTKYVFISELRKVKFDDASWEHDNEPPPSHVEFSDDEEEKLAKQRQRNQFRKTDSANGVIAVRKKRRRNFPTENGHADSNGPQLLQGDLNRNPFGNGGHNYKGQGSKQWPPRSNNLPTNNQWPPRESSTVPLSTDQNTYRKSQSTYFGGKPNWQMQQMGYSQQSPGQPAGTQTGNMSFTNTEQTPSFVNYNLTSGFNLNIPPPSYGPNNQIPQSLSQFNPSQPPPLVSTLNTGPVQTNVAQYPTNSPVQTNVAQYPTNSPVQPNAAQYPANSQMQQSTSHYPINSPMQHTPSPYPVNSHVQHSPLQYPTNSQMQHIPSQYPLNSQVHQLPAQYPPNSPLQNFPSQYPLNNQPAVQYPANSPLPNCSPYYPSNNPLPSLPYQYNVNSSTPYPPPS